MTTKKELFWGCVENILLITGVVAVLLSVCAVSSNLPTGEMAYHWLCAGKLSVLYAGCCLVAFCLSIRNMRLCADFSRIVVWSIIIVGGIQALWGILQIYGLISSNHSLYAVTGSFFNPGPYSGYLAMIFPIALHEWLKLKDNKNRMWIHSVGTYVSLGVLLLIVCILPAGMSRSAWLAAIVSGLWVCGMHYSWGEWIKKYSRENRRWFMLFLFTGFVALVIAGFSLFHLKADSANGRLFMWKVSSMAIAEHPWQGYGIGRFAKAYGDAQEKYFSTGNYTPQEELVAGSPEYSFNEYLGVAIEYGIPVLLIVIAFIGFCLWRGITYRRIGICGGILSLMIFAFSSYPMQYPGFVLSFVLLLSANIIGRSRIVLAVFAIVIGFSGISWWSNSKYEACKDWTKCKMLYNMQAYAPAKKGYEKLYPELKERGAFLFEYGHCLHKLKEYDASTKILQEAMTYSCDPMILNIIGKNYQAKKEYAVAEEWLIRSTYRLPGRIYPHYLLAKLYAETEFDQPEKLKQAIETVLTKEPKVQSTAVMEMREEVRKLR